MIRPFKIHIPQSELDNMFLRIRQARWPDEIPGTGWSTGTNLGYMKELADYWLHSFDWKTTEKEINEFPNYIASINGHEIHFIHIKGKGKKSIPLLITHGWPGSFLEMIKLIPLLTENDGLSFDLVIPSIPGFGFSEQVHETGFNNRLVAELWNKLMEELGYNYYGAQGGDIGAGVSTWLALLFPENLIGLHLNFIPGSYKPFIKEGDSLMEEFLHFRKTIENWSKLEGAYSHVHVTKPLTLAYGLNDSPVGLCAWIIEKFNSWSEHQGKLHDVITKDELLANVTLYWLTQTIHSSIRIYNENSKAPLEFKESDFVIVPVAFAKFPKELPTPPRSCIERGFNIIRWTEMPAGGHFAAIEQPDLLAQDIIDFFKILKL